MLRVIRRDPHHFPEHLVLLAQRRLASSSCDWARQHLADDPGADAADIAEDLRTTAARFARVNGALAGTPFFIALVPAYINVLWEQARMVMRLAALGGQDPRLPDFAAELLFLRGVHESPAAAQEALSHLGSGPAAAHAGLRARLLVWARLVYRILVLAGFLSRRQQADAKPALIWRAATVVAGIGIYIATWVFPLTFMVAMSWSCEHDTRSLGTRAIAHYSIKPVEHGRIAIERNRRAIAQFALALVSLTIPIGLIVVAVARPVGHAHLVAVAGFIGLAVVLAAGSRAARR
jgi:hypothetical protein